MPKAYERCLRHVAGKVRNAHAVCTASNAGNVKAVRAREAKSRKLAKAARRVGRRSG